MKIRLEPQHSPTEWVRQILEKAKSKAERVVEHHLVEADLQKRYANSGVYRFSDQVTDIQTRRPGNFIIGDTIYHVTATLTPSIIQKCDEDIKSGLHPLLLVPSELVSKAKYFAEYIGIEKRLSVIAIEDFVALNIIEMATGNQAKFFEVLQEIINIYNERLEEVETDMSLKIEVQ